MTTTADLCEQIGNVDLKCPLEPGSRDIEKAVDLPKEIPPVSNVVIIIGPTTVLTFSQGKYTVEADVYTKDDRPITCLTASVSFTIGVFDSEEL